MSSINTQIWRLPIKPHCQIASDLRLLAGGIEGPSGSIVWRCKVNAPSLSKEQATVSKSSFLSILKRLYLLPWTTFKVSQMSKETCNTSSCAVFYAMCTFNIDTNVHEKTFTCEFRLNYIIFVTVKCICIDLQNTCCMDQAQQPR